MIRGTLTGSARIDALVPVAAQLAAAVRDHNASTIATLLDGAITHLDTESNPCLGYPA